MTRRVAALGSLMALSCVVALMAAPVYAKEPVKVSGRVVMGTKGAALPADLSITIVGLDGNRETHRAQVTPAATGIWAAEGFTEVTQRFVVAAVYKAVTYSQLLEQGQSLAPAPDLVVYEPTNDSSVVSVSSDTMTVVQGKEGGTIEVLQVLRVANSSDRTFVGTVPASSEPVPIVRLPVPEGAFDVAPIDNTNRSGIGRTAQGLASTAPLLPSKSTISYIYRVRAPRTGWQVRREVFYPTAKTYILIGAGLELKAGPGFGFVETKELDGKTYRSYRGEKLLPGAVMGVDIGYAGTAGGGLWFGLSGIFAVVLLVVLGAFVVRRSRAPEVANPSRSTVVEEIALLDIKHEDGSVSEEEYRRMREAMKGKLT